MTQPACSPVDFSATAIYTGENRMVRVQGELECPGEGYELSLRADNPGVNPDRTVLVLALTEEAPPVGTTPITRVAVDETFDVSADVTRVHIRRAYGEPVSLDVQEPA